MGQMAITPDGLIFQQLINWRGKSYRQSPNTPCQSPQFKANERPRIGAGRRGAGVAQG